MYPSGGGFNSRCVKVVSDCRHQQCLFRASNSIVAPSISARTTTTVELYCISDPTGPNPHVGAQHYTHRTNVPEQKYHRTKDVNSAFGLARRASLPMLGHVASALSASPKEQITPRSRFHHTALRPDSNTDADWTGHTSTLVWSKRRRAACVKEDSLPYELRLRRSFH